MGQAPRAAGRTEWRGVALVLLGLAAVLGASLAQQGVEATLRSERGGVEAATLIVLGLAGILLAMGLRRAGRVREQWHLPAAIALLALRELDFHDWFFEPGLLHVTVLTRPAPLLHKLATGATVALILVVLWRLARFGGPPFLWALWNRAGWAWSIALGTGLAALSTLLDGAERKLAPYGIVLDPGTDAALGTLEEAFELIFALSLLLGIARWTGGARAADRHG